MRDEAKRTNTNTTWHLESLSPRLWQRQCDVMCGKAESFGRQESSSKSDLTVQRVVVWDVWMSVCVCEGWAFPKESLQSVSQSDLSSVEHSNLTQRPTVLWNASFGASPEYREASGAEAARSRKSSINYLSSIRTGKAGGLFYFRKQNSTLF